MDSITRRRLLEKMVACSQEMRTCIQETKADMKRWRVASHEVFDELLREEEQEASEQLKPKEGKELSSSLLPDSSPVETRGIAVPVITPSPRPHPKPMQITLIIPPPSPSFDIFTPAMPPSDFLPRLGATITDRQTLLHRRLHEESVNSPVVLSEVRRVPPWPPPNFLSFRLYFPNGKWGSQGVAAQAIDLDANVEESAGVQDARSFCVTLTFRLEGFTKPCSVMLFVEGRWSTTGILACCFLFDDAGIWDMLSDSQAGERVMKALIGYNSLHESSSFIGKHMANLGADVYYHGFCPQGSQFHPARFFSSAVSSGSSSGTYNRTAGINSVGIIRAPRGVGKESIILVTPYNSQKIEVNDAASLDLGFAIFSLLNRVTWLAKDIVWVASDSHFGEHAAVAAWLNEYHDPDFFDGTTTDDAVGLLGNDAPETGMSDVFQRAGTIAAGLVVKFVDGMQASDGVINIVQNLAVHRQSSHVSVGSAAALPDLALVGLFGRLADRLSSIATSVNGEWRFGIPTSDYIEGSATLASPIYNQELGMPTGAHGAFRDYQVDAIPLEISARIPLHRERGQSTVLLRSGRMIEGVVRSFNNLLEKFHQSFSFYLLTSANQFVSFGVYMISFSLLVAIVAAALFSNIPTSKDSRIVSNEKTKGATDSPGSLIEACHSIHSAKVALAVHLWAITVSLIPCLILRMTATSPNNSILLWAALTFIILLILYFSLGSPYSSLQPTEWRLLKMVMIAAASIGLCLMSVINFATSLIGTFFVVPMCLMAMPLKRSRLHSLSVLNMILGIAGFPATTILIFEGTSKGYENVNLTCLWQWTSYYSARSPVAIAVQMHNNTSPVLVATDVAIRKLNVKDIGVAINYHISVDVTDYDYDIERRGKAKATRVFYTFLGKQNEKYASDLIKGLVEIHPRLNLVMGFMAIPRVQPSRWLVVDSNHVNWNLNYWDLISLQEFPSRWQTLMELLTNVSSGSRRASEKVIFASCHMFAINIFREFRPFLRTITLSDEDELPFGPHGCICRFFITCCGNSSHFLGSNLIRFHFLKQR